MCSASECEPFSEKNGAHLYLDRQLIDDLLHHRGVLSHVKEEQHKREMSEVRLITGIGLDRGTGRHCRDEVGNRGGEHLTLQGWMDA